VWLVVGTLSSCGAAQSATPDNASREDNTGEETTSLEEGLAGGETTETTLSTPGASADPATGNSSRSENTPTSPAIGTSGMVSSANPLATQAGLDVLQEGGNAFDAAVAVAAALNVVEPMMSGIGGYGAIVIYDAKKGETRFLDPGTRMPATLDPNVFRSTASNYQENRCGAKAVVTPGNVNSWETLSKDYGNLEWRRLFDPAIELADQGFAIDDITAGWIGAAFPKFPENAKSIYGNNGVPLRAGERLVQRDLARSLGLIADQGAQAIYGGELGQAIDSTMRENGGFLTLDDLRNNRAQWRDTTSIDYRGYQVVTASPPATSWNALLRLGIMSRFNLQASDHNTTSYLHAFTEATKQASLAVREYAADPDIQSTPLDQLLSKGYWADQASKIDPSRASPSPTPTTFPALSSGCGPTSYTPTSSPSTQGGHTTHFVVADKEGNVVSATQTLGDIFGSKVMPQGTGIWLNDFIAWSRFEPAGNPFDAFPGRNALYGLCPTIVMSDGRPWLAIGTPGGRTIVQTTPQMLMNMIDFGMDIQQAIAAPRVSFASSNTLLVEAGIPQSVRNQLSALGHNVQLDTADVRGIGNAHGLTIEYDSEGKPIRFTGGSDPRGEGAAIGY
jgi:gamma-glutamyltranspeptidase/glutathione hydrolase